jgi:hypothetical protein
MWSDCLNNTRTRNCTDINDCHAPGESQLEIESCSSEEPNRIACGDGICSQGKFADGLQRKFNINPELNTVQTKICLLEIFWKALYYG